MTVRVDTPDAVLATMDLLRDGYAAGTVIGWSWEHGPTGVSRVSVTYQAGAEPLDLPGAPVEDGGADPTPTTRPMRRGRK